MLIDWLLSGTEAGGHLGLLLQGGEGVWGVAGRLRVGVQVSDASPFMHTFVFFPEPTTPVHLGLLIFFPTSALTLLDAA